MREFDAVDLGIIWSRLVSIADEMVSALVRTSFSTMVRESGDYSCMLFDARGQFLSQGTASVPSFTGTGPATLRGMLAAIPPTRSRTATFSSPTTPGSAPGTSTT